MTQDLRPGGDLLKTNTIKATAGWILVGLLCGLLLAWLFFGGSNEAPLANKHEHEAGTVYTCAMHPQIRQPEPGQCPLCGMELTPVANATVEGHAGQVMLSDYAQTLAGLETVIVGQQPLPNAYQNSLQLSGELALAEDKISTQVAHIPGRIEQLYVNTTGETIKQGQALASIYSPELLAAQQELIQATKLEGNYSGILEAARQKLRQFRISNSQIERIENEGRTFDRLTVVADAAGVVTELMVAQGAYVNPGQPLMQIARLSTLWAELEAYENQLPFLQMGQNLKINVAATGQTYPAKITFINPVLNAASRTVEVRAELDNSRGQLRPQMLVQAKVSTENIEASAANDINLPRSAVLWTGERSVVYVKDPQTGGYQMQEVSVQAAGNGYTVTEGLHADAEVVVNGAFVLDAEAQLHNKPSMMNRARASANSTPIVPEQSVVLMGNDILYSSLSKLLTSYLSLKNALVEADETAAKTAATGLRQQAAAFAFGELETETERIVRTELEQIKSLAAQAIQASTLDQQRGFFRELSTRMVTLAEAFPNDGRTLYRQYCPMADGDRGAVWLSAEPEILNPYYGSLMLKCGEVQKTF